MRKFLMLHLPKYPPVYAIIYFQETIYVGNEAGATSLPQLVFEH